MGIQVLLIEDDPDDVLLLENLLAGVKGAPFQLTKAARLSEGLAVLSSRTVDVILSDLGLPDSRGLETLAALQAQASRLPIVILTGNSDEELGLRAVQQGAQDYLVKGRVDAQLLARSLQFAIERKKLHLLREELVALASHEIRNPLTVINWTIERLAETPKGSLAPDLMDLIELAHKNAIRMLKLLQNYLDIAKIESGKMKFELRTFGLRPFLERIVQETLPLGLPADVRIVLAPGGPADVSISADSDRLEQVVVNLLSNAVKFSPRGGTVSVSFARAGDVIRVSVKDQGPGVPEEFHDRIFQKFMQAGAAKGRHEGTGLGLSLSKAIVEKLGGSIGFESSPSGATFYFELPAA